MVASNISMGWYTGIASTSPYLLFIAVTSKNEGTTFTAVLLSTIPFSHDRTAETAASITLAWRILVPPAPTSGYSPPATTSTGVAPGGALFAAASDASSVYWSAASMYIFGERGSSGLQARRPSPWYSTL